MTKNTLIRLMSIFFLFSVLSGPVSAQDQAPPKLQAALIMKLLAFYSNLGTDPFDIYVVDADPVAAALQGMVGQAAGKAKLNKVTSGEGPPEGTVKVVYVGGDVPAITAYSQSNQVLTVTGVPDFVSQGVTLGIGVENKKPKILLNLASSKAEGINWNPAILKVAKTL